MEGEKGDGEPASCRAIATLQLAAARKSVPAAVPCPPLTAHHAVSRWFTAQVLEFIAIDVAFSTYLGWVTVASLVNVSIALTSSGWDGAPWTQTGWACVMLTTAAVLALLTIHTRKDVCCESTPRPPAAAQPSGTIGRVRC